MWARDPKSLCQGLLVLSMSYWGAYTNANNGVALEGPKRLNKNHAELVPAQAVRLLQDSRQEETLDSGGLCRTPCTCLDDMRVRAGSTGDRGSICWKVDPMVPPYGPLSLWLESGAVSNEPAHVMSRPHH